MNKIISLLIVITIFINIIPCNSKAYESKTNPKTKVQSKSNLKNVNKEKAQFNKYIELKKLPINYSITMAKKNGDVVDSVQGHYNIDKLDKFYNNVKTHIPDMVRVTIFNDEGNPIIQDLVFKNNLIKLSIDGTRDSINFPIKQYVVSIFKTSNNKRTYYFAKSNKGLELPLMLIFKR
jgi:hypothetical protein